MINGTLEENHNGKTCSIHKWWYSFGPDRSVWLRDEWDLFIAVQKVSSDAKRVEDAEID